MEKIYGYKEEDVVGLAEYVKRRNGKPLTEIFAEYGKIIGKAKGTVRNMYYALVKYCEKDEEFRLEHFGDNPLTVGKIVGFNANEEKELIKKILIARKDKRSVRSVITELAGGDMKTALRYQNKYRNAVKNNPGLISEIIGEIRAEDETFTVAEKTPVKNPIPDAQFKKLKSEIDNLISRVSLKLRKENEYLKDRIGALEMENMRLSNTLYGNTGAVSAMRLLKAGKNKKLIN